MAIPSFELLDDDSEDQDYELIRVKKDIKANQLKKVIDLEIEKLSNPFSGIFSSKSEVMNIPYSKKLNPQQEEEKKSKKS